MINRNTTTDENGYQYYYDYEQRLIMIEDDSYNTVATFEYDALGRRIEKYDSAASESTYYYYNDKWQVLCEHDGSSYGNTYVYGNYVDEG